MKPTTIEKSAKLQKVLANQGLASRRTIEKWILEGRIKIDDRVAKIGDRVTPQTKIVVDGKLLTDLFADTPTRVLLYHKAEGEICTRHDPEGRPTVFANLPPLKSSRWIMVGRLDLNSSGLLLFTNDGALAHKLLHPSSNIEREYLVRVCGEIDQDKTTKLLNGIQLEDGRARFLRITKVTAPAKEDKINQWYKVVVNEGRNRLVRRLFDAQKLKVNRLKRIRFGNLILPRDVKPKHFIEIKQSVTQKFL